MAKRKFELSKIDASDLKELDGWKGKMETLVEENPFVKITDKKSYELAKKRRTTLKSGRTEVQNQDKMIGSFISNFRKKTMEIGKEIIAIVHPSEEKQQAEIDKWEKKIQEKKEADAKKEEQRIEKIKERIEIVKNDLKQLIDLLTFENREEAKTKFDHFIQDDAFDYEEFAVVYDPMIARMTDEFNTKIDGVIKNESQRLENVKLNIESEINKRMVDAQNLIVLSDPKNIHSLGESVDKVMLAEFDFGDENERFEKIRSEYADKVSERIKFIHDNQVTEQRNRVISIREGLLDLVFQMTIHDSAEKVAYIKNALEQKMEDLLVPEEFDKMVERVNEALKQKLELIAQDQEREDDRLAKRLEGRIKMMKDRGFVEVKKGKGMWTIKDVIEPIGEDDVYDFTDPEFKEYIDGVDQNIEDQKNDQDRKKRLDPERKLLIKYIEENIRPNVFLNELKQPETKAALKSIEGSLATFCDEVINKLNSL